MTQVRSGIWYSCSLPVLGLSACIVSMVPAWASNPIPVPLAGAVGPFGLLAAAAGYGLYRLVKHCRNRG